MKLISNDEFMNMHVKGRGRASHVFTGIYNLKPGEHLLIEKADWKKRTTPSRVAAYIGKKYARKFKTVSRIGEGGWVVSRIS